ncbi:MAG: hypothetical protein IAE89_04475 [Anaerolineae bacterium]|nr:hypothetical protein [Anaerolineae bacterium]
MRGADEILHEANTLADEYAALINGVQEDGYVDMDEAVLGEEYAEDYRKTLQALKKESNEAIKEIRGMYRERTKAVRESAPSIARGRTQANLLADEQVSTLRPYQEGVLRLDRLLAEARLTKAAFHGASERLKEIGADTILIPRVYEISTADDEDDALAAQAQADNEDLDAAIDSQIDAALREMAGRWLAMWSEANDRLALSTHPKQASHLRGIKKALELALQDVETLVNDSEVE